MGITYNNVYFVDNGERWTEETWNNRMNDPSRIIVIENNKESDVAKWMSHPETCVCSDAMPVVDGKGKLLPWDAPYEGYNCHPRTAASRSKIV